MAADRFLQLGFGWLPIIIYKCSPLNCLSADRLFLLFANSRLGFHCSVVSELFAANNYFFFHLKMQPSHKHEGLIKLIIKHDWQFLDVRKPI